MAIQQLFTAGPLDADGTPQVSPEPTTLLVDDYSIAITTYHTTGGTAPTITSGYGTTSEGTTASATSYLRSTLPYYLRAATNLRIAHIVTIESTATANNTRWWGYGTNQATPTATAPVLNGAVWLLDSANAGALTPAIFSNGVKTTVALNTGVTMPARDANPHRYQIDYRQSRIDWYIDGVVIATRMFPQLAVAQGMYEIWGAANTATAPNAHTFQVSSSSVADLGANNEAISDGINPGIMASVKLGATAPVTTDNAFVIALHPSSTLPNGTNTIGFVKNGAPAATDPSLLPFRNVAVTAAVVVKASSGRIRRVRIYNPNTAVAYLQILNTAASPAVGTNIIEEYVIPASSTYVENIDIPTTMSTGISVGATTAAGGTTVVTTGLHVQIWYI